MELIKFTKGEITMLYILVGGFMTGLGFFKKM